MKGCLKYVLYGLGILFVLGIVGAIISPSDSKGNPEDEVVLNSSNIESSQRQKEILDSIKVVRTATRDSVLNALSSDKRLRESKDEFKPDYAFYYPKKAPKYTNVNWFFPYIGKANSQVWLRLKVQYKSDDWLFINKVTALIKNDKGESEVVELYEGSKFERDNSGGQIWEYADIEVDDVMYLKLLKLDDAESVKVRYTGTQYYKDRNLTSSELGALSDILDVYKEIRQ